MSTREVAYNIVDCLSEEQLEAFVSLFGQLAGIPNEKTQIAMLEADKIAHDPSVKSFNNASEMVKEIFEA